MTQITEKQFNSLQRKIYEVLIAGYDDEGNELGMGDISNCEDAATQVVNDWMQNENIQLTDN